ncbi:unnamed protein product [Heligmosomoides polygyrus]|uniref:Reverse transcriptase domain-containing protein n=1 Tax=Heligmosomoides polygyrus TaxID=6339 RepID=A0A183G7N9_HELPZ|nr:unnamed protein product [Heligmosomoides polygyrus]
MGSQTIRVLGKESFSGYTAQPINAAYYMPGAYNGGYIHEPYGQNAYIDATYGDTQQFPYYGGYTYTPYYGDGQAYRNYAYQSSQAYPGAYGPYPGASGQHRGERLLQRYGQLHRHRGSPEAFPWITTTSAKLRSKQPRCLTFIDLKKAFDYLATEAVIEALLWVYLLTAKGLRRRSELREWIVLRESSPVI